MKINAYMSAYGSKNDIRVIDIPDEEIKDKATIGDILALAFKYGQNDFQPQNHPSVSVGDVVEVKDHKFMVLGVGWKLLSENEFKNLPDNMASKHKLLRKMYE